MGAGQSRRNRSTSLTTGTRPSRLHVRERSAQPRLGGRETRLLIDGDVHTMRLVRRSASSRVDIRPEQQADGPAVEGRDRLGELVAAGRAS